MFTLTKYIKYICLSSIAVLCLCFVTHESSLTFIHVFNLFSCTKLFKTWKKTDTFFHLCN